MNNTKQNQPIINSLQTVRSTQFEADVELNPFDDLSMDFQ
jgi:hypothetical protein